MYPFRLGHTKDFSRNPVGQPEHEQDLLRCFLPRIENKLLLQTQMENTNWKRMILALQKQNQPLKEQRLTQHFQISNGRLFDVSLSNGKKSLRLCLPKQYKNIALQAFHEDEIAGHLGITKTLHKLTKRFI